MLKKGKIPVFVGITILAAVVVCTTCNYQDLFSPSATVEMGSDILSCNPGDPISINVTVNSIPINSADIVWKSSNPKIVEVKSDGSIRANTAGLVGSAEISASIAGFTGTCTVNVDPFGVAGTDLVKAIVQYYQRTEVVPPVLLPLRGDLTSYWVNLLNDLAYAAGTDDKLVILDLSECEYSGTSFSGSQNEAGDAKVMALILPRTFEGTIKDFSCDAEQKFTNLTEVSGESAKYIGNDTFFKCSNLTSVYFPEVTSIGSKAFAECTKLKNVSFPKEKVFINPEAFWGCTNLTTITIGAKCSIADTAFDIKNEVPGSDFGTYYSSLSEGQQVGTHVWSSSTLSLSRMP